MDIEGNDSDIEPQPQQYACIDINPGQRQRARNDIMEPMDATHNRHPFFTNHNITQVRLQTLLNEDAAIHHLDYKYIDLQLLRLIVPSPSLLRTPISARRVGATTARPHISAYSSTRSIPQGT